MLLSWIVKKNNETLHDIYAPTNSPFFLSQKTLDFAKIFQIIFNLDSFSIQNAQENGLKKR